MTLDIHPNQLPVTGATSSVGGPGHAVPPWLVTGGGGPDRQRLSRGTCLIGGHQDAIDDVDDAAPSTDVGDNHCCNILWGAASDAHTATRPLFDRDRLAGQGSVVGLLLQLTAVQGACWHDVIGQHLRVGHGSQGQSGGERSAYGWQ